AAVFDKLLDWGGHGGGCSYSIHSCRKSSTSHVTARRIAQPPKAAFVTRLQPFRLPGRAARQLPDQSTTLWVESSSTGDPRLRGALPEADMLTIDEAQRFVDRPSLLLIDDFVRRHQQCLRHDQLQRLRGLKVDDEIY